MTQQTKPPPPRKEPGLIAGVLSTLCGLIFWLVVSLLFKTYYLVHRISGWHDKIESFELYSEQPSFDNCGISTIEPLFGSSVDDKDSENNDQHVVHIYLEPQDRFALDYMPGERPTPDHYKKLTLERRSMQ